MRISDIIEHVGALEGVLVLAPREGDGSPELAWGDVFFYYAPEGAVPRSQPFATIVTKDYPDDTASRLDRPGVFRLNIAASTEEFRHWTTATSGDPDRSDVIVPHPVYGSQHWLAVVNPGPKTTAAVKELLGSAHQRARDRHSRRAAL